MNASWLVIAITSLEFETTGSLSFLSYPYKSGCGSWINLILGQLLTKQDDNFVDGADHGLERPRGGVLNDLALFAG